MESPADHTRPPAQLALSLGTLAILTIATPAAAAGLIGRIPIHDEAESQAT
jgi:hypothetical protein